MKKLLVLIGVSIILVSNAYAAPAAMKLCYSNFNGNMTVRSRCAKGEVQLSGYNIGSLGLQGQAGTPGADGKNGTLDPKKCIRRESSASGSIVVAATVACLQSEFLVSSGCFSNSTSALVREERLFAGENNPLKENTYGGLVCTMEDFFDKFHTVTAQIMCCLS